MKSNGAITFFWEEIFPDFENFKDFIKANSLIVDFNDEFQVKFVEFCYKILSRHFSHQNIRYDTPFAFCGAFLNVFDNKFTQFLNQKKLIDAIHKLTLEDYEIINTTLTNQANNNNEIVQDPRKLVNFVSSQVYNEAKNNKLEAYFNALNNIPTLNIYNFLRSNGDEMGFIDLFMQVLPPQTYFYEKRSN